MRSIVPCLVPSTHPLLRAASKANCIQLERRIHTRMLTQEEESQAHKEKKDGIWRSKPKSVLSHARFHDYVCRLSTFCRHSGHRGRSRVLHRILGRNRDNRRDHSRAGGLHDHANHRDHRPHRHRHPRPGGHSRASNGCRMAGDHRVARLYRGLR